MKARWIIDFSWGEGKMVFGFVLRGGLSGGPWDKKACLSRFAGV